MTAIPKQTPLYFGATREEFNTYRRRTTQIRQAQLQRLRKSHNQQNLLSEINSVSGNNLKELNASNSKSDVVSTNTSEPGSPPFSSEVPKVVTDEIRQVHPTADIQIKKDTKDGIPVTKTDNNQIHKSEDSQITTSEDQNESSDKTKLPNSNTKPQMRWNVAAKLKETKNPKSTNKANNINKSPENGVTFSTGSNATTESLHTPYSVSESSTQSIDTQQIPAELSNSVEPLGNVLLRIMFQPQYVSNKPASIQPRGLINTGNICFMSSILQSLTFCSPFYNILLTIEKKTVASFGENDSPTPLLDALIDFISGFVNPDPTNRSNTMIGSVSSSILQDSKKSLSSVSSTTSLSKKNRQNINVNSEFGSPYNPQSFYQRINKTQTFLHLKWGEQEDAEEFLGYLLNGIHDEFLAVLKNMGNEELEDFLKNSTLSGQSVWKTNVINTLKSIQDKKDSEVTTNTTTTSALSNSISSDEWHEVVAEHKSKKGKSGNTATKTNSQRIVEVKPTPISNLFSGQFRSELHIPNIKNGYEVSRTKSITLDPFQHIQLDISDSEVQSVHSALIHLSLPEQISYKSTENKETYAQKQIFIDRLPKVLVIHLKRFTYVTPSTMNTNSSTSANNSSSSLNSSDFSYYGQVQKLKKKISYGHTLEIPPQVLSKALKDSNKLPFTYKLSGVVYHHGSSSNAGHYTVDVLRQDKSSWIRIDDTKVHSISEDAVINDQSDDFKCAYILIYEKC